ncbi:MAG TPA: translation initiation factor [Anaerolineae bacterium]|jgi:translation initiation factor 1|nr:translation initiation factor [Ardenticatenia bacterium]HQZ72326.1 translation initiation factor [Anaerolineae bacterium]HRA21168.1 translation initiation factor [Anaerolineae bacterium]
MPERPGRLVYSTDATARQRAEAAKAPPKPPWLAGPPLPPEKQTVSIRREVKGRGGKTATVVYDLRVSEADFKDLARRLREACGSGGSAKEGQILIQGDHRDKAAAFLQGLGFKTKFTGG